MSINVYLSCPLHVHIATKTWKKKNKKSKFEDKQHFLAWRIESLPDVTWHGKLFAKAPNDNCAKLHYISTFSWITNNCLLKSSQWGAEWS